LPSDEDLEHLQAIVIPGSVRSVCDDSESNIKLAAFIKHVYDDFPGVKLVGICFGHQMLARALGGTVR